MRISLLADGSVEPCSCAISGDRPFPFQPGGLHAIWNNDHFARTRRHQGNETHRREGVVAEVQYWFEDHLDIQTAPLRLAAPLAVARTIR